ncbi:hypothetical protein NQ314_016915 [Rhamnusium bicolor]|uniref:Uncharacterized protein n=1 Tax=Rhamnusium bicolor TaxID=1586634 RepID=A0AAV8WXF6_9CUCU|nr:hypothetical protein NQ314_016915 [Rhamnusium bicolor]
MDRFIIRQKKTENTVNRRDEETTETSTSEELVENIIREVVKNKENENGELEETVYSFSEDEVEDQTSDSGEEERENTSRKIDGNSIGHWLTK